MDRADVGRALDRALRIGPTAALLVPEAELVALVMAARQAVFCPDMFNPGDGPKHMLPPQMLDDLDKTSEPFADMLDLPFSESSDRRKALQLAATHVRAWIDAGCITLPPVDDIRLLIGATA